MKAESHPAAVALTTFLVLLPNLSFVQGLHETCSAYMYPGTADVDVKLAVILGMHGSDAGKCDPGYLPEAMQQIVAMNWAANLLNGNNQTQSFIPGVRIGVDVYDDCYTEYLAARHAGALASHIRGISGCLAHAKSDMDDLPVAGVIGTSISQTTTIVANILKPTSIPVVGISATLPELGDKSKYPGFVRTVPSDLKQAKLIIELAKRFSWSYIVGVQTSDNYGRQGMAEVQRLAEQERICISVVEEFDLFSDIEDSQMELFVRRTLFDKVEKSSGPIGVVYFGRNPALITLLEYIKSKKVLWLNADAYLKNIYWVASDAVVSSKTLSQLIDEFRSKIMVVGPPEMHIGSFEDYFFGPFLENPPAWVSGQWRVAIMDIVRNSYGCPSYNFTKESLAGCNIRSRASSTNYMTASVDAVYLLANTIKSIQENSCPGVSGICTDFISTLQDGLLRTYRVPDLDYGAIPSHYLPTEFVTSHRYLKNVSGDFEALNQSQYSIEANIYVNSGFREIGEFKNGSVNIYPAYETIMNPSQCRGVCVECLDIGDIKYLYSPGNIVIMGFFSIHWESTNKPFECGSYRDQSTSYVAMVAFLNAIKQLRLETNLEFGYLVIDDCYSVLTASKLINKILSGDLRIVDSNTGDVLDPSKVAVAIGAQASHVTMASLPVLKNLNIPVVSYSSTSPNLDNPISYPYFSRTVSSDAVQAKAMTRILKELRVTFVGAIVISNSYGRELYKLFRTMAEAEKICVDDAFEVSDQTNVQEVNPVLLKYRSKNIKVIVAFVMDSIASKILSAVKQEDTFVFIASEAWGPNSDILNGDRGEKARGSLVLGASTSKRLGYGLKEYLQTIEPFSVDSNSWLRDFWQAQFKCNLPGGFNNVYQGFCPEKSQYFSDEELDELADSPLAVHSTMATMSAGFAIKSHGGSPPFNPESMTQAIRTIHLTTASGVQFRPFLDSGNGNSGFQIYNVQQNGNRYVYVDVGSISSNGDLNIDKSNVKFYDVTGNEISTVNSSCLFHTECTVCADDTSSTPKPIGGSTEPFTSGPGAGSTDSNSDSAVIALAVICGLLVLIIIVIVVLAILFCLGKISFRKDDKYVDTHSVSYSVASHNIRGLPNQYEASDSSDLRPPLPARKFSPPVNPQVYNNKAFSDIVTTDVHEIDSPDLEPRARSQSLPLGQDQGLEPQENLHLPDSVNDLRPLPKPHTPVRNVLPVSPRTIVSNESSPNQNINQQLLPQSKPTQEVQPLPTQQPSFYLRDNEISPNSTTTKKLQPSHAPQAVALDPYNLYDRYYKNGSLSPEHSASNPTGPIIFQNVSDGSMVYHMSPSAMVTEARSQSNPNKVYIQTADGMIVAVPREDFLLWQSGNGPHDISLPPLSTDGNDQQAGQILGNNYSGVLVASNPPAHHSYINTEAPAPCGQNDYITPVNVIYAGSQQAEDILDHGINPESHPLIQSTQGINAHNIYGSPLHGMTSTMSPVQHGDITHTVDSSDYPVRHPNVQMVPHPGTFNNGQVYPQSMAQPPNTVTPFQHYPQNSSPVFIMQPPDQAHLNARPTSLAVVPVHLLNQQNSPQQPFSTQAHKSYGDLQHTGKTLDSQGNSPSSLGTPNHVATSETKLKSPQASPAPNRQSDNVDFLRTSPKTSNVSGNSDTLNLVSRPRSSTSPSRLPHPRVSDILEESDSFFEVDV